MLISSTDLINLHVYTQSAKYLGEITSFDLDIDSRIVSQFYVKTGLIKGLWHEQLIIAATQVISITKDKMVVEDNINKQSVSELEKVGLVSS